MSRSFIALLIAIFFSTLTSCQTSENALPKFTDVVSVPTTTSAQPTISPTLTQEPPRLLTICSKEPSSLFLYADTTSAARSVLQAIYDGPVDMVNYTLSPVILEKIPTLENGDLFLQPLQVQPGDLIIDAEGKWTSLETGVIYRPSGCLETDCAMAYEGTEPVEMDSLIARFRLLPGIRWSDGEALTAADSVYAYQVFETYFESASPEVLQVTHAYTALDERIVEWMGIPGYVGRVSTKFFSPLPEHQWGGFKLGDLLESELTTRNPLGWGPYILEEWVAGDHITMRRNPNYYRSAEGLPHFDFLVYRFMENGEAALDALLAGECDLVDRTLLFWEHTPRLQTEQAAGRLSFKVQLGTAWELAVFGIESYDQDRMNIFNQAAVRRAAAMCIDRQRILDELLFGLPTLMDSYLPTNHPLNNLDVTTYRFDPVSGSLLLETAGWLDQDEDPQTPRTAAGLLGIPDGTPLSFQYLLPAGEERLQVAEIIQDGLASCGFQVEVLSQDWEALMQPGPDGLLFGRQFDLAQFAWSTSLEPPCNLFMSDKIPGPYPEYPRGWGGGNLSGFSNPDFDTACAAAQRALPGSEAYLQAHHRAQAVFAEELPALPLYQRIQLVAARPDICDLTVDPSANSVLNHLELLDYGTPCDD